MAINAVKPAHRKWTGLISKISSAVSITAGTYILIGWVFYYWLPSGFADYLVIVKPNSALCFVLVGIALWLKVDSKNKFTDYLSEICSAMVFLLGTLTLFQYFFNIDLGIDQGFFKAPISIPDDIFPPGRMSPLASANFVLIGFSLFFFDNKVISHRMSHLFMYLVILSSFFSFLVHIYKIHHASEFFGIDRYSQMSMLSIVVFLFMGVGVLVAHPERGIASLLTSKESGGSIMRRLVPPAILLPVLLGYFGSLGIGGEVYAAELGISLLVMGTVIFFISFIVLNSYLVNRVEVKRKETERALRINQAQLQSILDNTSAVIYIYDLHGRYLLINKQFEKVSHKSATEIIGRTTYEVFPKQLAVFQEQVQNSEGYLEYDLYKQSQTNHAKVEME